MTMDRAVMAFAGTVILVSLRSPSRSPYWLLLTAFAGLNLFRPRSPAFARRRSS